MEKEMKRSVIMRAGAAACALGCAAALGAAAPAFADTNVGNTKLYVQADSTQLSVTVPSVLHFSAKSDGEFICPTDAKIINNSVMAVHVSSIGVSAQNAATLTPLASVGTGLDAIGVQMTPAGGTAVELADYTAAKAPTTPTDWSLARTDAANTNDEKALAFVGRIGAFGSINPVADTQFGNIVWTVAAGA